MNEESLFPYVTWICWICWICLKVYIKILFSDDVLNWTLSQKGLDNIILQQVFYRTISLLFWNISVVLLFFTFVFCLSGSPLPAWLWQNNKYIHYLLKINFLCEILELFFIKKFTEFVFWRTLGLEFYDYHIWHLKFIKMLLKEYRICMPLSVEEVSKYWNSFGYIRSSSKVTLGLGDKIYQNFQFHVKMSISQSLYVISDFFVKSKFMLRFF